MPRVFAAAAAAAAHGESKQKNRRSPSSLVASTPTSTGSFSASPTSPSIASEPRVRRRLTNGRTKSTSAPSQRPHSRSYILYTHTRDKRPNAVTLAFSKITMRAEPTPSSARRTDAPGDADVERRRRDGDWRRPRRWSDGDGEW